MKGTTAEQDNRFSDKEKKLLKQMKFDNNLQKPVDMTKVKLDVIKPWIAQKINAVLGIEDDVVVHFVFNQLEAKSYLLVIRGTDVIWASNLELLELIFFLKEQAARSAAQRAGIYIRRSRTMLARCAALRAACSFRKKINSSSSKFEAQITSVPLITNR
ncbi:Serine/arginine repetitive matrix protein 1 [Homalodisca vitripennis]|nr:Serine/arginine repetitive matrix protein 1 [Homalodisca vitripennis]